MAGEALEQEAWSLTFLKKSAENIYFLIEAYPKKSRNAPKAADTEDCHWSYIGEPRIPGKDKDLRQI